MVVSGKTTDVARACKFSVVATFFACFVWSCLMKLFGAVQSVMVVLVMV